MKAFGGSAGDGQGKVKRFTQGGNEIGPILGEGDHGPPVQQVLYARLDHTLAVAHSNGLVRLYPSDKPLPPVEVQRPRPGPPPVLAFAPDRPVLAVARSTEVHWWDLLRSAWEDRALSLQEEITALAYTPDGKYLALATRGPDVFLCRVSTGENVHTFRGHRDSVLAAVCHPKGHILATGSSDGDVRVWDLRAALAAKGE
jgi:WD40 repeat protein